MCNPVGFRKGNYNYIDLHKETSFIFSQISFVSNIYSVNSLSFVTFFLMAAPGLMMNLRWFSNKTNKLCRSRFRIKKNIVKLEKRNWNIRKTESDFHQGSLQFSTLSFGLKNLTFLSFRLLTYFQVVTLCFSLFPNKMSISREVGEVLVVQTPLKSVWGVPLQTEVVRK